MTTIAQEFKDDFTLLLEAGFVAVKQCNEGAAISLFRAAEALNPKSLFPKTGLGYMFLCKLNLPEAIAIFEEVVAKEPHNEVAQTLLGVACSFLPSKTGKGEEILESRIKQTQDPFVKKAASTALDFANQHIKKAPSPVEKATFNKNPKKGK